MCLAVSLLTVEGVWTKWPREGASHILVWSISKPPILSNLKTSDKNPIDFKRTESLDKWVLNSDIKIQLCCLSKATGSKINHTWMRESPWWGKCIKTLPKFELEWPPKHHLEFSTCCQISRYPMSYRSAFSSQARHSGTELWERVASGHNSSCFCAAVRAAMEGQRLGAGELGTNAFWDHVFFIATVLILSCKCPALKLPLFL